MGRNTVPFDRRQHMLRPDYEVTHKRDTYLADVELHHHDFYELLFLVSGDISYTVESRVYQMLPGDLILISPKELHQARIQPNMAPYERFVVWIDPAWLEEMSGPDMSLAECFGLSYGNRIRFQAEDRSLIMRTLQLLYDEVDSPAFGSATLQRNLLQCLLILINRMIRQGSAQSDNLTHSSVAVSQAVAYINLHYNEDLSLDDLADRFFVSKHHLSHQFNRQVGTSVYRYILKKRLMIARQQLQQGRKPNQIYTECGFRDYAGFYRAFKAEYGVSPREVSSAAQQRQHYSGEYRESFPPKTPAGNSGIE